MRLTISSSRVTAATVAVLAVLTMAFAPQASAQAPQPVPAPAPGPAQVPHGPPVAKAPDGKKPTQQNPQQIRQKLRENIRAMRAQKLAEVLKPDAPTAAKLQEISERYGDQVMQLQEQARDARRDLVKQLQSPTPDQAAVTRLSEQLMNLHGRVNRLEEERMTAVRKVLTPVQFGRFLVAWPKINRQIQEKLYQALQKMGRRDGGAVF